MTLKIALFGAGRIGRIHADTITRNPDSTLAAISDPVATAADELARKTGSRVASPQDILSDASIGAVLIASSTDTHAELTEQALAAGKAVFCEKPLDLKLARAKEVERAARAAGLPAMMAFNRRFDPQFGALKSALDAGEIGAPSLITITSYDPAPPPIDYIKVSGGLFRDMAIHDFDVACWLLDAAPVSVQATASVTVDAEIGAAGDIDTASTCLRFGSGTVVTILNSRRAAHGYDQRIEVLGETGMLQAGNVLENTLVRSNADGVTGAKPEYFFLQRYMPAYEAELNAFVAAVTTGAPVPASLRDGVISLAIAEAATASLRSGQAEPLDQFMGDL